MSTSSLDINNIITISVQEPPAGLANYNVNTLVIFTKETPIASAVPIDGYAVYLSPSAVAADWGTSSEVYAMANAIFSQTPNILSGGGQLLISPMSSGETLATVIPNLSAQVYFGGILWAGYAPNDAEILAAAAVVQPLRKLLFVSDNLTAALNAGGLFFQIQAGGFTYSRSILYTPSQTAARLAAAAYAGRAMSTDFTGSNTTITMQMKDLATIQPDPGITQTILSTCKTVGVDVYTNIAGIPKVFSSGGNDFFDNVYNLTWLVFALQVAGFNAIATTPTKLPQTEPGMAVLKGAFLAVLEQAVQNGFVAPGKWNSPELFGNPDDLKRNVLQIGYYIYSLPVNLQNQADRVARKAPLVQLAVKYAGAIQSASVIVSVNP